MSRSPEGLPAFFDRVDHPRRSLVFTDPEVPVPFRRLLEKGLTGQSVDVAPSSSLSADALAEGESAVALIEDGEVLTTSPLAALQESYLLVNSDLYRTGTVGIEEFDPPDVLMDLDETLFRLRGYPESNKEKLLLILVSRHIERLAWEHGHGTLRASFQELSRLAEEPGTWETYERVLRTDVDVHAYGVPDWEPPADWPGTVHSGRGREYQNSWFVVFEPPPGSDARGAALVAVERGRNEWDGMWTYRPELVADIHDYVRTAL
jgi:hypothetical protein